MEGKELQPVNPHNLDHFQEETEGKEPETPDNNHHRSQGTKDPSK